MANDNERLSEKAMRLSSKQRTVDITPTWVGVLPVLLLALENGTARGKQLAREELKRMAEAADEFNKLCKK